MEHNLIRHRAQISPRSENAPLQTQRAHHGKARQATELTELVRDLKLEHRSMCAYHNKLSTPRDKWILLTPILGSHWQPPCISRQIDSAHPDFRIPLVPTGSNHVNSSEWLKDSSSMQVCMVAGHSELQNADFDTRNANKRLSQ